MAFLAALLVAFLVTFFALAIRAAGRFVVFALGAAAPVLGVEALGLALAVASAFALILGFALCVGARRVLALNASTATRAAASRAMGTRGGLHDT